MDARASDRRRQRRGQAGHRQAGHRQAVRRRRYPSLLPAALLGLAASVPRPASAAELTASGPAACPDVAELSFRVERAIGMPLAHAAPLRFDVRFAGEAAAFTARLAVEPSDLSAPRSERMLGARQCGELADAVAVAIALALGTQPAAQETGVADAPETSASTAAPALVASSAPTTTPASAAPDVARSESAIAESDAGLTPALAVSVVGDAGSLPGLGLGLGLGAELRVARFALRASGTLLFDRHVALPGPGTPAPGADMSLVLGSLAACTSPFGAAAGVAFVCAGWELGRVEAIGTGVQAPRRGEALWSAPRVDAGLAWTIDGGPLRPFGQLTIAAPLERDDFYLRDLGSVHRAPAVVGRLSIGVDVSFR